jgi:hypothetical protein
MRAFRHGLVSVFRLPDGRRFVVSTLLLGLLATPLSVGLFARDKESRRNRDKNKGAGTEKTTVARKGDDAESLAGAKTDAPHALTPALEAARSSRESLQKLPGYTCTFTKQEQLKKNSPLLRQMMTLKFRREPFSVYLKYVDPHAGREVIYVDGRYKGKLQVHEADGLVSLVGTVALAPTSGDAMRENRYPVTMIGMEKMIETAISDWEAVLKYSDVQVDTYPQAKVGDVECTMFEVTHPVSRPGLKYHRTRVYFDKKTNLPIRSEQYAFPTKAGETPPLYEEYTYSDIKIEGPLSDADFDINNKSYSFK